MPFEETLGRLDADIEEGLFTRGAQLSVSVDGKRVLDLSVGDDGLGRAMSPGTLFRVYCTLKPVTALAVGNLLAAGALDLDDPLSDLLPEVVALRGGVTFRHVLNHTAGLHQVSGVAMEMVPAGARDTDLNSRSRPAGWGVGRDAGYSEHFGWHVLGKALVHITGEPLRDHIRRSVLDPLGMNDTFIGMTEADVKANLHRIGLNVDLRGWRSYPMLFERTPRILQETNPAYGGYTTARDLELLYRGILAVRSGRHLPGLPPRPVLDVLCTTARPHAYDVVLARECDYGLGFMTNLPGHHFGVQLSKDSFGHSGNVGSSFAFADPASGLAVGVVFNGITDPDSAFVRRPALTRALHRDLGPQQSSDPGSTEAPPPRRWGRRSR